MSKPVVHKSNMDGGAHTHCGLWYFQGEVWRKNQEFPGFSKKKNPTKFYWRFVTCKRCPKLKGKK